MNSAIPLTHVEQHSSDARPRTVVLHQFVGIGDLVWHVPYFRAVAEQSYGGQVSVIASPTTFARDLLAGEHCVSDVIDFDRRPRKTERRRGRHAGLLGVFRMGAELRERQFERIVIFSDHANRGVMAWTAQIPERLGYGCSWLQRIFLTRGPFIRPYRGPSVSVYKNASAFAVAHGFVAAPVIPRLNLPKDVIAEMAPRLEDLPKPIFAFAVGSSEPFKQWGARKFGLLAQEITQRGGSVVILGGPGEAALAHTIEQSVDPASRVAVRVMVRNTVLQSAATLALADACIGNDTGMTNLAAALGRPSIVLLGNRPLLDHDPLMIMVKAARLTDVEPEHVLSHVPHSVWIMAGKSYCQ
jgi:heptosyltransferase-2